MKEEMTLYSLIMLILAATILSILMINVIVLQYGITNDYVFFTLQEITEDLDKNGVLDAKVGFNVASMTLTIAETYQGVILWFDNLWFGVYLIFIMFTFLIAYKIKQPSDSNFIMILFFGIFIFLFMGYLVQILVDWFVANITLKLLPTAMEFFPKFEWFTNNAGIINMFHALILLFISRVNYQNAQRQNINNAELGSLDPDELN